MSEPAARRRDAQRSRQRLLEAARVVFARDGLEAPLKDIAAEADLATATVYRHFPDRKQLIDALFDDALEGMLNLAQRALEQPDPWQGLVDFILGSLEIQAADRGVREAVTQPGRGADRLAAARARFLPIADQVIERARTSGRLRPDVTTTDIALLSTLLTFEIDYTTPVGVDTSRRHATIILDGLRARPDTTSLPDRPLTTDELARAQSTPRGHT